MCIHQVFGIFLNFQTYRMLLWSIRHVSGMYRTEYRYPMWYRRLLCIIGFNCYASGTKLLKQWGQNRNWKQSLTFNSKETHRNVQLKVIRRVLYPEAAVDLNSCSCLQLDNEHHLFLGQNEVKSCSSITDLLNRFLVCVINNKWTEVLFSHAHIDRSDQSKETQNWPEKKRAHAKIRAGKNNKQCL